jgi:glycosyltransferase involved in cell wall biosynthesis
LADDGIFDRIAVVVHVGGDPARWVPVLTLIDTIRAPVVLGGSGARDLAALVDASIVNDESSVAELVGSAWRRFACHLLVVGEPVLVPHGVLDNCLAAVDDDMRIGTVSFLSNSAGLASFPHRGGPRPGHLTGHDATSATARLRTLDPVLAPVSVPMATGGVVLLSQWLLGASVDLFDAPDDSFPGFVADVSLQGRRRGFVDLVDPSTYVQHAADLAEPSERGTLVGRDAEWVFHRHPFVRGLVEREEGPWSSPFTNAHNVARSKLLGLRVIIDGSCLGPTQMGTQVGLVAIVDALAASDQVADIQVGVPGTVPAYAEHLLATRKVVLRHLPPDGELDDFSPADVLYRSFQPDRTFSTQRFRRVASRVVVGILDLIAYQIGSYLPTDAAWLDYRDMIRSVVHAVDGVTTISRDVRNVILFEQLPIDSERVFAVPYGTQHLTGTEQIRMPTQLPEAFAAGTFVLCVGTNYTHKNRDIAIRVHQELLDRGYDLGLVLVGASVPWGSSRTVEAEALRNSDRSHVALLPDVSSEERNWLLQHAAVVLYPTSAEGFGLVPYEAAWFGTPTVYVPFGPLAEIAGSLPVEAVDWRPSSIATAAERLLLDPTLARDQVECLVAASGAYNWQNHAECLAGVFRKLLSVPPR